MVDREKLKNVLMGYVDGSLVEHLDFDNVIDNMMLVDDCFVFVFPSFKLFLDRGDLGFVDVWVEQA